MSHDLQNITLDFRSVGGKKQSLVQILFFFLKMGTIPRWQNKSMGTEMLTFDHQLGLFSFVGSHLRMEVSPSTVSGPFGGRSNQYYNNSSRVFMCYVGGL